MLFLAAVNLRLGNLIPILLSSHFNKNSELTKLIQSLRAPTSQAEPQTAEPSNPLLFGSKASRPNGVTCDCAAAVSWKGTGEDVDSISTEVGALAWGLEHGPDARVALC
jgi:hypothetical protein